MLANPPCFSVLGDLAVLAARKAVRFAIFPPLTNKPPYDGETPMNSASHRTVCFSTAVAIGLKTFAPTFGLTAAANKSANAPMGVGEEVMYPKNFGCPFSNEWLSNKSEAL